MTFYHFDRRYRHNEYLFVTGEISIGEYQNNQYELLKRYVNDTINTKFRSDAQESGKEK